MQPSPSQDSSSEWMHFLLLYYFPSWVLFKHLSILSDRHSKGFFLFLFFFINIFYQNKWYNVCSYEFSIKVTPIPETSPMVERSNAVSAMCQQLSQGLSLLSSTDDPFLVDNKVNVEFIFHWLLIGFLHLQ
jgi:hypothetical protein